MLPEQNTTEFKDYLVGIVDGKIRHKYYEKSSEHHEDMEVHVDGTKPTKLLEINRPNEPQEVKDYRLKVYKPVTKSSTDKVINTVSRIFNPRLYRIDFEETPTRIREGEGLHDYLMESYPFYISVMNYMQEVGLRQIFSDPNGVIVVWPEKTDINQNDYFKPIPNYKESCHLVDFKDEEYYVFNEKDSDIVTIIDRLYKRKYKVTITKNSNKNTVELIEEYEHGIGEPPCFRIGGIIKGSHQPYWYNSFISGVLPHWDKVVTMTSDLDGSIVNHLYPERWEYQVECDSCGGTGHHKKEIGYGPDKGKMAEYNCELCFGTGRRTSRGPFGQLTINREALAPDAPLPTPPADYINKDIEPIRELKTIIKEEEQKGFSAINMEILAKIGENQSGVAKTIDRQDLDSFLMRISNHIFKYFLPNLIWYTAVWRYKNVLPTVRQIIDYLPTIHGPKDFSVLSINELMQEYKEAADNNVSSFYKRRLEVEISNAKFSNNEEERLRALAIINLNPFPNKSSDDLLSALSVGAIRKTDWIKSNYIELLVNTAIQEDEDFLTLGLVEQNIKLNEIISRDYSDIQPSMINAAPGNSGEN